MDVSVQFDNFALITLHTRLSLAGVLVSSATNATSFNDFSQVKPFFQKQGEGAFCIPLDFSANANGTSLKDGQNVTIQVILPTSNFCAHSDSHLTLLRFCSMEGMELCTRPVSQFYDSYQGL
jgi:hypothetical protein